MENTTIEAPENAKPAHLERFIRPGRSLQELASELQRIDEVKRDFTVPVSALSAAVNFDQSQSDENGNALEVPALSFRNGKDHAFNLNNWSGGQVASFTDIPQAYFRRLSKQNPKLLVDNINHGLTTVEDKSPRLLRTIDGKVRGFLSDKYLRLDSSAILEATLPMLIDFDFQVVSCELTEQRMYLKAATQRIQGEVKAGDVVSYGVMISSSDVGAGSIRIEPYFLRLWCLNGAVSESKFRRAHLGRSAGEREVREIMSDETRSLSDQALLGTIRDWMGHTMKPEIFQAAIGKMKDAASREIKNLDLEEVVDVTMTTVGITGKGVREGILQALADGNQNAGLTQWGLMNSFTAAAKMPSLDYDTATDLERAGGLILNLNKTQWQRIAEKSH